MKTIFKYPIAVQDCQNVNLPFGARILCVQIQKDSPFIWAQVESDNLEESRVIYIFGTGHELKTKGGDLQYIGTLPAL